MIHSMKLQPAPFKCIRSGRKTIELRLNDEKRRRIRVGDFIVFTRTDAPAQTVTVRVTALYPYASFAELYAHLPLTACGYAAHELADAAPSDMDAYYPPEEQARWGVLGIGVALWQSPVFPLECG